MRKKEHGDSCFYVIFCNIHNTVTQWTKFLETFNTPFQWNHLCKHKPVIILKS